MASLSGSHKASDGKRRSWYDTDVGAQNLPPVPTIPESATREYHNPPATPAGSGFPSDRIHSARPTTGISLSSLRRPQSSHSNAAGHHRIASNSNGGPGHSTNTVFGPNRQESNVRALINDFSTWESPTASIMMFQREWKLPSFQQIVSTQSATTWAKNNGWAVTMSSELFFMAYIFYKLPKDVNATQNQAAGEKIVSDRLLLRMRFAMEDFEGKVVAGEAWRDAITAIILTIDARIAPNCPVASSKRNFSQVSLDTTEQSALHDSLPAENHIRRMKILEKHLSKVTESFSSHFWPRQEDHVPIFNTFPRRRTDETTSSMVVEKKPIRRARGWSMIPTLLTFKSDEPEVPVRPESPTLSTHSRKRPLYPMGLSIAGISLGVGPGPSSGLGISEHRGTSVASSHDLSTVDSVAGSPACHSRSPSRPASPVLSAMSVSPISKRSSVHSHLSGGGGMARPSSPVYKRGTLGLGSSNDVATLTDEFGQSLNISPRPPLKSTSSQSSGASSGFNVSMNAAASSGVNAGGVLGLRQPTSLSVVTMATIEGQQRKRKAGEAGVVGKTKGGFEVVWSATDLISTSYVMVPVPKAAVSESPTKMFKQNHSRLNKLAVVDVDTVGTQSQPNLKSVLDSITREINLDSSYVLLLPPPPPVDMSTEDDDED
ncbi:hypothetical protein LPJ66_011114, partial [Kickxella alabastrina]